MVVVSGTWAKNVAISYPAPDITDPSAVTMTTSPPNVTEDKTKSGEILPIAPTAKATLICRPNSHPFQERTLTLDHHVKVGRSVARARAMPTNAIFDCKVLSRHHALLWFDEDTGKFFLQDTKSSNGTFVNNNRLAPENEQREVNSGDIVQFGVDVIENNRKVTHGCIIATLKLYLPDGKEAKASPSIIENSSHHVPLDELYKLHQIIQEATEREQSLEIKLLAMQSALAESKRCVDEGWQAYVGEERLLSRISALEIQLTQARKNWNDDKIREELQKMQKDSAMYQVVAKEALRRQNEDRLKAVAMATEQERGRVTAEQDLFLCRETLYETQRELEDLSQELEKETMEKSRLQREELELQARLNEEMERVRALEGDVEALRGSLLTSATLDILPNKQRIIYNESNEDDLKSKEEQILAAENESQTNGDVIHESETYQINLTVEPVRTEKDDVTASEKDRDDNDDTQSLTSECGSQTSTVTETPCWTDEEDSVIEMLEASINNSCHDEADDDIMTPRVTSGDERKIVGEQAENEKHVTFKFSPQASRIDDSDGDEVDSKTLKYKYQSAQNELKKRIDTLESVLTLNKFRMERLESDLVAEKQASEARLMENEALTRQVRQLEKQLSEQQQASEDCSTNRSDVSLDHFVALEEELVMLKQRFCQVNEDKMNVQKDLVVLKTKYDHLCNKSYDKMYWYMAPLVLMILYLVVSATIS